VTANARHRFAVRGRVQGVGYRAFARAAALRFGLTGFAHNEPDGSVLCEAEGPAAALEQFAAELRRGPRFSRVDGVAVAAVPLQGGVGFDIG
jgi:acylphosphatase